MAVGICSRCWRAGCWALDAALHPNSPLQAWRRTGPAARVLLRHSSDRLPRLLVRANRAWAPAQMDTALWAKHIQHIQPFVAELGNEIVGYADVQKNGYIDHFFVSGLYPRQGIGTRLMGRIHEEAMSVGLPELRSEVSKTAEPFFARHGFHVLERRVPVRRGVTTRRTLSPPRQRARHLSQTAPPTHESPRR